MPSQRPARASGYPSEHQLHWSVRVDSGVEGLPLLGEEALVLMLLPEGLLAYYGPVGPWIYAWGFESCKKWMMRQSR